MNIGGRKREAIESMLLGLKLRNSNPGKEGDQKNQLVPTFPPPPFY